MLRTIYEWLFGGITVAQVARRKEAGALLIDVRRRDEWRRSHVPGAHHIPLADLESELGRIPPERELLFICRTGLRSARAVTQARLAGVKKAANVRGGMSAWQKAGLPVNSLSAAEDT